MTPQEMEFINVLGTSVAATNPQEAQSAVAQLLAGPPSMAYVCVTGVHGVMEAIRDASVRQALNGAAMCVPDGVPLTWFGKLRGKRRMQRVYGPDFMLRILSHAAAAGHSNYFYGGREGIADELAETLQQRFPGLIVAGTSTPPFRPLSDSELDLAVEQINASGADILWVGISTPKQDLLMARLARAGLQTKVMFGVGAAFDFHTGRVRQAPRWIQRIGMEWCFRLCAEPRRLWRRYLRNNPMFLL